MGQLPSWMFNKLTLLTYILTAVAIINNNTFATHALTTNSHILKYNNTFQAGITEDQYLMIYIWSWNYFFNIYYTFKKYNH